MLRRIKQTLRKRKLVSNGVMLDVQISTVGYGIRTGTWHVHAPVIKQGAVVYSFGVGNNIEWDLQMIQRHNVELHAFDPTPRSVDWIKTQTLPDEFTFHAIGLSNEDGEMSFFVPIKTNKINYSGYKSPSPAAKTIRCPVNRLGTLASQLNHEKIDILKMDIEGAEFAALPDVLDSDLQIGQLLIEFHYNYPDISFREFLRLIERIRGNGYSICHISERGYEFTFIRTALLQ